MPRFSSLQYFAAAIVLLLGSWAAAKAGLIEVWIFTVPLALLTFLIGAVVNHREHTGRR